MSTSAEDYVIQQSTKAVGAAIEAIENLRDDLQKINPEIIAEKSPDQMPLMHSTLEKLAQNLVMARIATIIFAVMSDAKIKEEEDNSNA